MDISDNNTRAHSPTKKVILISRKMCDTRKSCMQTKKVKLMVMYK